MSSLAFSQEKLHYDVYAEINFLWNPRIKIGCLEKNGKNVDVSFLSNELKFTQTSDSTYREFVNTSRRKEIFDYFLKDSCYFLKDYYVTEGDSRKEKKELIGKNFDKKHKTLLQLFNDFEKGNLNDSIHAFVFGVPYSIKIYKSTEGGYLIYNCDLGKYVRDTPSDDFAFDSVVKAHAEKINGNFRVEKFSTDFKLGLGRKKKHRINIEGYLD